MSTTLVTLHNVIKYDVKKAYNLEINKGDFILIKGQNGSGKTTLIRLVLSFIKPNNGQIIKEKIKIGYLPEQMILPDFMRGFTYLNLCEKMKKAPIDPELLHLFDVPLFRHVQQLSKGNKQKLAIISVLTGKPDLIIMDEPLSGLDENSIQKFTSYLKKLKDQHKTFMISSHHETAFQSLVTKEINL